MEAFGRRFPGVPQVACFDTAFHRDLPRVAQLLPIPRRYNAAGVRRFGFHGLSYTYLMDELRRIAGDAAADGRVILAHLGSGASMAAVQRGRPIDTTMAFTPTAGLVMGTRPGDLDPGLARLPHAAPRACPPSRWTISSAAECGPARRLRDQRRHARPRSPAARPTCGPPRRSTLFCYSARKWIGALAAAMGGLDTLVFAGGIGEHSPEARRRHLRGTGVPRADAGCRANLPRRSHLGRGQPGEGPGHPDGRGGRDCKDRSSLCARR